jgi:propanediol utilization protein
MKIGSVYFSSLTFNSNFMLTIKPMIRRAGNFNGSALVQMVSGVNTLSQQEGVLPCFL